MTGDAGTPLTAKWQIIELDEAQGIGSVEIEDGFTLRVGFESHAARANLRTRSMTEAA